MTTTGLDANALAHRALLTSMLYGLAPRRRDASVVWAAPADLAAVRSADVLVTVDGPELDAGSFAAACEAIGSEGVVAVVVASSAALGLLSAPQQPQSRLGTDAYARARAWAAHAEKAPRALAVSPARLRELVAGASTAGLALVEREIPRARVQPKHAVDRAILATITLGATAHPLLFVRERRAPKGGLVRVRDERLLDGWIEGRGIVPGTAAPVDAAPSLLRAALEALAEADAPMRGKDLLREARLRWTDAARAAGAPVTTSSADSALLAEELVTLWLDGAIEVLARDPVKPLVPP